MHKIELVILVDCMSFLKLIISSKTMEIIGIIPNGMIFVRFSLHFPSDKRMYTAMNQRIYDEKKNEVTASQMNKIR